MPNRDGTGPQGKGPMTGRGNGPCNKNPQSQNVKGRGLGMRRRANQSKKD